MLDDEFIDGAFLGTLVERGAPLSKPDSDAEFNNVGYRFTVDHWLGGDFEGTEIVVASSDNGASCGFENEVGAYLAVYLFGADDGVPNSGLCSNVDGKDAIAALTAASPTGALPGREAESIVVDVPDAVDDPAPTSAPSAPDGGIELDVDDGDGAVSGAVTEDRSTWVVLAGGLAILSLLAWVAVRTLAATRR